MPDTAPESLVAVESLYEVSQFTERQGSDVVHQPECNSETVGKGTSNGSADLETQSYSGGHGQEDAICVEGLVPGIDFCNHESKAAAMWEVDDGAGSATGIPFSIAW
eukprot:TRINITY_DN1718_c0_g1_i1.p2 TRINITY_DN1718_c0_g1~~TRINITY_DN1718_c0_g1_i1.p2  ORF type:complete len:107 (-),score=24.71 TRINITY_DN1718_c0_g1_i1:388-708(-)